MSPQKKRGALCDRENTAPGSRREYSQARGSNRGRCSLSPLHPGNSFACRNLGGWLLLLASSGERPGLLLSTRRNT